MPEELMNGTQKSNNHSGKTDIHFWHRLATCRLIDRHSFPHVARGVLVALDSRTQLCWSNFSSSRGNMKRLDTPSAGKRKRRWDTLKKFDNSTTQTEIYRNQNCERFNVRLRPRLRRWYSDRSVAMVSKSRKSCNDYKVQYMA